MVISEIVKPYITTTTPSGSAQQTGNVTGDVTGLFDLPALNPVQMTAESLADIAEIDIPTYGDIWGSTTGALTGLVDTGEPEAAAE